MKAETIMINSDCMSYYCALRYLPFTGMQWLPGCGPTLPRIDNERQISVGNTEEVIELISGIVERATKNRRVGILLSGGIDSAILAAFLPSKSKAYTIDFEAKTQTKEAERASQYAQTFKLDWQRINVNWKDYIKYEPTLMKSKKAPLHAVEVALHKAALKAKDDGLEYLLVGNGADSTFGGMDKLLSRDWTFNEFVERYSFIPPTSVLKKPVNILPAFEPYRQDPLIDVVGFLKNVHGNGIIQSFHNSVAETGIQLIEPFEECKLKGKLDIERIRNGEPKYILFEVFSRLYPEIQAPAKVPFARPMDEWLANYSGPRQPEFIDNLSMHNHTGDQRYLLHSLDRFINLLKAGLICP